MTYNTELFAKIHESIDSHAYALDMGEWEQPNYYGREAFDWRTGEWGAVSEDDLEACGTTRCVAGWALHHTNPAQSVRRTAQEILGDPNDSEPYIRAGATVLGLSESQAALLFLYTSEKTAARIVELFANGSNDAAIALLTEES